MHPAFPIDLDAKHRDRPELLRTYSLFSPVPLRAYLARIGCKLNSRFFTKQFLAGLARYRLCTNHGAATSLQ
jgi:hypothetical protein